MYYFYTAAAQLLYTTVIKIAIYSYRKLNWKAIAQQNL